MLEFVACLCRNDTLQVRLGLVLQEKLQDRVQGAENVPGGGAGQQLLGDGVAAGGAHDGGGARHADADAAADAPDDAGQAAGGGLAPDRRLALEEPQDAPALRGDSRQTSAARIHAID